MDQLKEGLLADLKEDLCVEFDGHFSGPLEFAELAESSAWTVYRSLHASCGRNTLMIPPIRFI
jgi:hypothetical protein